MVIKMKIDIEKLAFLARIKLDEEEKQKLQKEFGDILDYVSQLQSAEIMEGEVLSERKENFNILRDDSNPYQPEEFSKRLLDQASRREGDYIKTKKII